MAISFICDVHATITMGKGGGGTNTVTQNSAPPQYVADAYKALLARGNQVASAPFSQPQQPVAGFTPNQETAFNTIANTQGMTQPYTAAGVAAANQGSQAIYPQLQQYSQGNLSQYENPYTQDVINSTMAQARQQQAEQQSQLMGQGIQSGASPFGGDRAGVAAGVLAGQQALANNQTIAGLENQNFAQAQSEFNNQQQMQANTQASDAWRQLSAAQLYPALGTGAQQNTLNQANSQLQAGAMQQQLAQEQLNAPYQQQLAALAYPYQQTQFLGGLTEAIGSGSGGTGTSTTPGPSAASQWGGIGLTGLAMNQMLPQGYGIMSGMGSLGGMMGLKSGGVAGKQHFDLGGIAYVPDATVSVVPEAQNVRAGNGPPAPPKPEAQQKSGPSLQDAAKILGGLGGSSAPTNTGGISPAASSIFDTNIGGSFGRDTAMASQGMNDMNFMGAPSPATEGISFKNGGVQHKNFGGEILPILGDIAGAFFGDPMAGNQAQAFGNFFKLKNGGIAGRYDSGGMITTPQQAAMDGANPMTQQQASAYANMPLNQLMQLQTMQPNNPLVQRAIQQKKMGAGSVGSNTGMASGGVMPHFDDGGSSPEEQVLQGIANDPSGVAAGNPVGTLQSNPQGNGIGAVNASDLMPPDAKGVAAPVKVADTTMPAPKPEGELDAQPQVSHEGETSTVTYGDGKKIDTGLPSFKDNGLASNPWEAVMAAGLSMMAGRSPHALENIGAGGLEGLNVLGQQRAAALKENQAQVEAKKLQDDLDLRRQEMQNMHAYQTGELAHGTASLAQQQAYQKEEIAARNREIAQQGAYQQGELNKPIPDTVNGGFIVPNPKDPTHPGHIGDTMGTAPVDANGSPIAGEAYLATLPKERQNLIKALSEGRQNYPSSFALAKPYWQQVLNQLNTYNPEASQQTAPAVAKFNFGPHGNQTRYLNVAVNHLDTLNSMADALNNNDVKALNAAGNFWQSQTGSPAPTNFNTVKQIVGDEVTKAVIGAGGTGADRDKAQSVIDAANSPEQLRGAIQSYKALMTGQLGGLKQQYETSTGRHDFDKYLTSSAKAALLPTQQPAAGHATIPPVGQRQAGQTYTNPNGVSAKWTGTGWVQ